MEQYATDVVAVLDALGIDQAHYFGYSLGGWTGFDLAKHMPDRLRSLAIGGTHPYGSSLAVYRGMLSEDLEHCLAFLETAAGIPLPEEMGRDHFRNDIDALRAAYQYDRPDISALIPAMTLPCLLFAGENDSLYPAIRHCSAELPKATFLSVSGLNHIQLALQLMRVLPALITFFSEA